MKPDPTTASASPKLVWLCGEFVPESTSRVSAFDRGFLYGDGLFETMRVWDGRVAFWDRHLARLEVGLRLLRFRNRPDGSGIRQAAGELVRRNGVVEGILRLQVTRGGGARGYSPRHAGDPTVLLSTHPLGAASSAEPPPRRLATATVRVWSGSPLNQVKSTSKALHVLARAEADDQGADEALLLNERGELVEGSGANLFWVRDGCLETPPVQVGALPGVTRAGILRLAPGQGLKVAETAALPAVLLAAQGAFLTNSVWGPVAIGELDGRALPVSPWVGRLRAAWRESLAGAD